MIWTIINIIFAIFLFSIFWKPILIILVIVGILFLIYYCFWYILLLVHSFNCNYFSFCNIWRASYNTYNVYSMYNNNHRNFILYLHENFIFKKLSPKNKR